MLSAWPVAHSIATATASNCLDQARSKEFLQQRELGTQTQRKKVKKEVVPNLSGTGDSQRDSRESICANHSQLKPYFYSSSGRFARITRISDSRESPDSRESCESIRANHATKRRIVSGKESSHQRAPNPPEFAQPRLSRGEMTRIKHTPKFVASHLGNTSHVGTNTPKFVPSRWG